MRLEAEGYNYERLAKKDDRTLSFRLVANLRAYVNRLRSLPVHHPDFYSGIPDELRATRKPRR